jgi:dUTPase
MHVTFNLLHSTSVLPTKAYDGDFGFDLSIPDYYIPEIVLYNGDGLVSENSEKDNYDMCFTTFLKYLYKEYKKDNVAYLKYKLGISLNSSPNLNWLLCARSSITNLPLMLKNGVGVIDNGYTGELEARFTLLSINGIDKLKTIKKVCQIIPLVDPKLTYGINVITKAQEHTESTTIVSIDKPKFDAIPVRATNGFGSSGY